MIICATFANRRCDPETVELVHAWDEWSVESNPKGYEDTKAADLASWGEDLLRYVTVEIQVPMGRIREALDPQVSIGCSISHVGEATTPGAQS